MYLKLSKNNTNTLTEKIVKVDFYLIEFESV